MELFSFFWQDKKKNRNRTGVQLVLSVLMYLALFGMISVMFYFVSAMMCEPLVMVGMGWLYFALMGLIGVALGAFGSVFNTFASLYSAKDNEMLLAMPIPPAKILQIRLMGVYAMGLLYELLVMIPVLIKYYMVAKPDGITVLCSILVTLILSIFVLTLSAVLGWGVAFISTKTKHKSMITVVLSLIFIAGYYYVYSRAVGFLQEIAVNPQVAGNTLGGRFSPVYHMGIAAEGNLRSLLLFTVMVAAVFLIVYLVLAKSYVRIITTNKGEAKVQYKEKRVAASSVDRALLRKEFRRFLGSPNYMLNCGLGILFMIIAAVALFVKADTVTGFLPLFFAGNEDLIPLVAMAAIGTITTMNDITAPSVSLEGKNLWLVQSFPVTGAQVLMAKLKMHLILTLIPAAVLVLSVEIVLKPSIGFAILIPVATVVFILVMALLGLFLNLKFPNLTWTNEVVPIKQSMSVMIALFGGWAVIVAFAGGYYFLRHLLNPMIYLVCVTLLLLILAIVLLIWVKKTGTRNFETL